MGESPNRNKKKRSLCRKLVKLYEEWLVLRKSKHKTSDFERIKREKFTEKLDRLFDIAHESALDKLGNDDDKQFLLNQRSNNREGCLLGVDQNQTNKEKRRADRFEKENARKRKYLEEQEQRKKGN